MSDRLRQNSSVGSGAGAGLLGYLGRHGTGTISPLTSLRFFAALAIVIFHAGQWGAFDIPARPLLAQGVSFFFVLSGFILAVVHSSLSWEGVRGFYIRRIARIFPAHLLTLVIAIICFPHLRSFLQTELGALAFAANLLLVQAAVPVAPIAISFNGVSWSISTELFFYLLFPLFIVPRKWWFFCLLAMVGALAAVGLVGSLGYNSAAISGWERYASKLIYTGPSVRIFEFVLGVLAARLFLKGSIVVRGTIAEISVLAMLIIYGFAHEVLAGQLSNVVPFAFVYWFKVSGGAPIFASLIFVFAFASGALSQAISWRPIVLLGECSFALYMVHQIILRVFVQAGHTGVYSFGVALAAAIAASVAVYAVWELPLRKFLIERLSKR